MWELLIELPKAQVMSGIRPKIHMCKEEISRIQERDKMERNID